MTISRFDLIAAGANFYVEKFSSKADLDLPDLSLCFLDDISYWHTEGAQFTVRMRPDCNFVKIYHKTSPPHVCFTSTCFEEVRHKLAEFLLAADSEASAALRTPWDTSTCLLWPDPEQVIERGPSLDALLYSAIEKQESDVAKLYLNAGANPMARTYEGDCSARLGVANWMPEIFEAWPKFLDAQNKVSGETGLFNLARDHKVDSLIAAYRLGANPEVRNDRGQTVLDFIEPPFLNEVLIAISEAQEKALRSDFHLPFGRKDMRRRL